MENTLTSTDEIPKTAANDRFLTILQSRLDTVQSQMNRYDRKWRSFTAAGLDRFLAKASRVLKQRHDDPRNRLGYTLTCSYRSNSPNRQTTQVTFRMVERSGTFGWQIDDVKLERTALRASWGGTLEVILQHDEKLKYGRDLGG